MKFIQLLLVLNLVMQRLKSTIFAGIVGVIVIFLFMLFYYRLPGFISIITLVVFTFLVLVVFDWINAVLTLPGIAAIVLGIGMAVDANILAAERIREELRVGYSAKQAFQIGSKQSLSAIVDAQLTTLLGCKQYCSNGEQALLKDLLQH